MNESPEQNTLLDRLRNFAGRALNGADGRPIILYFLRQPERLGQLLLEMHVLKGVFSPVDYQIFVAHPRILPRSRHFSQDSYNIAMRDVVPLEAMTDEDDRLCYSDMREPVPLGFDPPITLIMGSDPCITRMWHEKYGNRRSGYPTLWLTDSEKERGERLRRRFGILPETPIVTLHVREHGLLRLGYEIHRNADIGNFEAGIRLLVENGYAVIRVGDPLCKPLPFTCEGVFDTPFIKDYDRIGEPYFMSVCDFMMGSYSGPAQFATAFNRPVLSINVLPQEQTLMTDEVVVHRSILRIGGSRPLGLAEISRIGMMNAIAANFEAAGCTSEENDSALIRDAVAEMIARRRGKFAASPALALANQKLAAFGRRRNAAHRADPSHFIGYSFIGMEGRYSLTEAFLARHPDYLDQIEADGSVANSPQ